QILRFCFKQLLKRRLVASLCFFVFENVLVYLEPEPKPHLRQPLLDFVKRALPEILEVKEILFGFLDEIACVLDARLPETVERTRRKIHLLDGVEQYLFRTLYLLLIVGLQYLVDLCFVKVDEHSKLML